MTVKHALIWSIVPIAVTTIDPSYSTTLINIIVLGWYIFSSNTEVKRSIACEKRLFCRLFKNDKTDQPDQDTK